MATDPTPPWIGIQLRKWREKRNLTAAQLAERIPESAVTKTIITNVESGRKRDLTVTELVQLSAALDISPLSLMLDVEDPFGPIHFSGLPDDWAALSNIEYARRVNIFGGHWYDGAFLTTASDFLDRLIDAEKAFAEIDFYEYGGVVEEPGMLEIAPATPAREALWTTGDYDDERWAAITQRGIHYYQLALFGREMAERFGEATKLSPAIAERLDAVRQRVVTVLRDHPDQFDYGQEDPRVPVNSVLREMRLDPKTGRLAAPLPGPRHAFQSFDSLADSLGVSGATPANTDR